MEQKISKRPWRKLVKKMQRKRRRQKIALQRDNNLEAVEMEKLRDPLYKLWLEEQDTLKRQQELLEENERIEQEQLWLRREHLAQKQFERDRLKAEAENAYLESERLKQEENLKLIAKERKKKMDELKLETDKAAKDFEVIMTCMQEYLEDNTMKTPTRLQYNVQNRPAEKSCDFFDKTNCCRFGMGCTFNHRRPMLAKIILIKHFFQHPLLEQQDHEEYLACDSKLELNERDLREAYDEFCEDVWPVLEHFGKIINFRTVRNVQAHLRGHVFVEYAEKRSALKAFINLQNRYYASKRLNVEFSNIQQWRTAVCGPSLGRKCPKGIKCNFLHLMSNIDNKYNNPINKPERRPRTISKCDQTVTSSPVMSWNSDEILKKNCLESRNWRWSESPEVEFNARSSEKKPKGKTVFEKNSCTNSLQRKFSSGSLQSKCLDLNRKKKSRSKSPCSHIYKNRQKSSRTDTQAELNKTESKIEIKHKIKESTSKERKSSHKDSTSRNVNHHESSKKSISTTSSKLEKKGVLKKGKRDEFQCL